MKKIIITLLVLLSVVTLAGCQKEVNVIDVENKSQTETSEEEVDDAVKKYRQEYQLGKFKEIKNMTELKLWLEPDNDASGIILMSRETCPYCQRLMPIISTLTQNENVSIYYADTTALKNCDDYDPEIKFQEIVDLMPVALEKSGSVNDDGEPAIFVPLLIFIKRGEVIATRLSVLEGYEDPSVDLDNAQFMQAYDEINSYINLVYSNNGTINE